MGYNLKLTAFDNKDTQRVCTVRLTTELIPCLGQGHESS